MNTGYMTARVKNLLGFTLVELLIVITLLGAIATMVIATINPIEQANRARDARFKTDSGQLISAIDRYFAAVNEFPWVTGVQGAANEDEFGFVTAGGVGVGLCGDANCSTPGVLISTDELKPEFGNRDFVDATAVDKIIYVGKDTGASASVYACFIPAAKSTRKKAVTDGNVYTITLGAASGERGDPTTNCDADGADWVDDGPCYVCVPE